jgi:hypothetical protein
MIPAPATVPGSDRHARLAELPGQNPAAHIELLRHDGERSALPVSCRRHGDRVVGHLAGHAPPFDARSIEVGDDRGPVHLELAGERVDRPTLAVGAAEIAATFCGSTTNNSVANLYVGFAAAVDHLRNMLDTDTFDTCARTGAEMTTTEAVHYAHHLQLARQHQTRPATARTASPLPQTFRPVGDRLLRHLTNRSEPCRMRQATSGRCPSSETADVSDYAVLDMGRYVREARGQPLGWGARVMCDAARTGGARVVTVGGTRPLRLPR